MEAREFSETMEARGDCNRLEEEGSSEVDRADAGRGTGANELGRDDENDEESGEAFFDALEQQ